MWLSDPPPDTNRTVTSDPRKGPTCVDDPQLPSSAAGGLFPTWISNCPVSPSLQPTESAR